MAYYEESICVGSKDTMQIVQRWMGENINGPKIDPWGAPYFYENV